MGKGEGIKKVEISVGTLKKLLKLIKYYDPCIDSDENPCYLDRAYFRAKKVVKEAGEK